MYVVLTCFVDDASVEAYGTSTVVTKHIVKAVRIFTETIQEAGMSFSDTKNVVCASNDGIAKRIKAKLRGIKVKVARRVVSLGSGTGGGTRRNVTQMNKRLGAFRARIPRFKALRRSGVRTDRLLRTGGMRPLLLGRRHLGCPTPCCWRKGDRLQP